MGALLFQSPHLRVSVSPCAHKLSPLVMDRGCQSFLECLYCLKYHEEIEPELNLVINTLSMQETYFWREMDQISTLLGLSINHEGKPEWQELQSMGDMLIKRILVVDDEEMYRQLLAKILLN